MSILAEAADVISAATTQPASDIPHGKLILAAINASLNLTATLLLVIALICIKRGNWRAHAKTMLAALAVSAVFLVFYLTSQAVYGDLTAKNMSGGKAPDWVYRLYFIVLIPHLLAAVGMLPLIAMTVWRAYKRDFVRHKKIAKPTWAIWFYVSVSGVLVYWMLYHWIPSFRA